MPPGDPTYVLGVDEAGKGPVFGSMFAAAVCVPVDPDTDTIPPKPREETVPQDVDDSKRLSPTHRESLAAEIREMSEALVGVHEVTPERIDDPETDMNTLTVTAQAAAIDAAIGGVPSGSVDDDPTVVAVVDAGDTDEARFGRRVADAVETDYVQQIHPEHGADESYPIVAAASIVAKVDRDAQMTRLAEEYGAVGSGYPSDPTTREFLERYVEEHDTLPPFARESWQTCADVLAAKEQSGLADF